MLKKNTIKKLTFHSKTNPYVILLLNLIPTFEPNPFQTFKLFLTMPSLTPKTDDAPLGHYLAAHLLRRSTYAYSKTQVDEFAAKTVSQALNDLFIFPAPELPEPIDHLSGENGASWITSGIPPVSASFHLNRYIKGWWIDEAMKSVSLEYKLMFFLHTNFTISIFDEVSEDFWDYVQLLRFYAAGSFKEFAKKVSINNLMSFYLDNKINFGHLPNENYAREFLELFTIGKGPQIGPEDYTTFTEHDVQQATKVLSGWRPGDRSNPDHLDPDTGITNNYPIVGNHNITNKTFSAAFQKTTIIGATEDEDMYRELSDFVDMVFAQMATARHICRKLYRFFVHSNISTEIETNIIEPLAQILFDNDYQLQPAVIALLKSQHFYGEDSGQATNPLVGSIIKSPLDLLTGIVSFFEIVRPDAVEEPFWHYIQFYHRMTLQDTFEGAGFNLFSPESVAGYAAYHQAPNYDQNWFSASSIVARYRLGKVLLIGNRLVENELIGTNLDIVGFISNADYFPNPYDATAIVQTLTDYLFPEPVDTGRLDYFVNDIFLNQNDPGYWGAAWGDFVANGNDTTVKLLLRTLVEALLHSPEYQTM